MLSKVIAQANIDHAEKWFERADKIVIVTHVSPDGDAIGSSLGLWHFLESQEKTVNVIVPNAFPDFLRWMPGAKDIIRYDKYTEFITQTIQVFGNLDNIKCARNGTQDGRSAIQYITEIAEYNGWSADMDMTNPFSKQIDECYNPLVLAERVKTFYNIVRERMLICSDNVCKLERVVEIIKDNPDKRFLIISKRGEYAATVTKYINDKLGEICGDYHDKIEDKVLVDDNGIPVLYKTGSKKGQPKIIKSKAISTLNLKAFNDGLLRVLSIKNNSTDSLETSVDEWILTSPLCDTIDELIYRYNNVNCSQSKLKVHKLYIAGTIEEASLKKEKLSANHEVIQNVNSDISAQNFDDIIC